MINTSYWFIVKNRDNEKVSDNDLLSMYDALLRGLREKIFVDMPTKSYGEQGIRKEIAEKVIGCTRRGVTYIGAITLLGDKIKKITEEKGDPDILHSYVDLLDSFMALASYRSFKHFCLYMEQDWSKKVWYPTLHLFEGWYYYANKMVLDGEVQFIEKQLPTSYGKSLSDVFLIAWIFGLSKDDDVLKVFGNPHNINACVRGIVDIMISERFAKVFPYYSQFNCEEGQVFEMLQMKEGTFKIRGSQRPVNLKVVGKESRISGVRAKFLFVDDITQAEDRAVKRMHDKDIETFNNVWFKRSYSNNNFYIIASGTSYSIYDLLAYLKKKFGGNHSLLSSLNKYTRVADCNILREKGKSVFVIVPKLDYETDESTYPEEFRTDIARQQRAEDYETFMAMEQQQPQRPKDNPFYYTALKEYNDLPPVGEGDRPSYHYASLDGKRSGADYCAMPICSVIIGKHYLVDVLYSDLPMSELYDLIVDKIIDKRIIELVVESNVNEGLDTLLADKLKQRGARPCKFITVYNTSPKDIRIAENEGDMKKIIYPRFGMYARSSEMGKAMDEFYSFTYRPKPPHDDFTDALSGYASYFIAEEKETFATISTFKR